MDLREETEKIILDGYNEANAQAKLCQDIILKAIYESGMAKNATIKGGVVMRSISGNARRATQDIDIDLIRYSILDESIRAFISKLNCIEGLDIRIGGPIIELNHQDYKGKRVTITITDEHANSLSLKMDIGVHKDLDIEQDQYSFDIGFQEDAVSLLINSPAQMITVKGVTQFREYLLHLLPGLSAIMRSNRPDILVNEDLRLDFVYKPGILIEQCASGIFKTSLLSNKRKGLARAASDKKVNLVFILSSVKECDIPMEVFFIQLIVNVAKSILIIIAPKYD